MTVGARRHRLRGLAALRLEQRGRCHPLRQVDRLRGQVQQACRDCPCHRQHVPPVRPGVRPGPADPDRVSHQRLPDDRRLRQWPGRRRLGPEAHGGRLRADRDGDLEERRQHLVRADAGGQRAADRRLRGRASTAATSSCPSSRSARGGSCSSTTTPASTTRRASTTRGRPSRTTVRGPSISRSGRRRASWSSRAARTPSSRRGWTTRA